MGIRQRHPRLLNIHSGDARCRGAAAQDAATLYWLQDRLRSLYATIGGQRQIKPQTYEQAIVARVRTHGAEWGAEDVDRAIDLVQVALNSSHLILSILQLCWC